MLAVLGGMLMLRSWRRAQRIGWDAAEADDTDYAPLSSFALAAAMFFVYALLLVGRGLPFWLGTRCSSRRSCSCSSTRSARRRARSFAASSWRSPAACSPSLAVTLVFEQLFYVRLP